MLTKRSEDGHDTNHRGDLEETADPFRAEHCLPDRHQRDGQSGASACSRCNATEVLTSTSALAASPSSRGRNRGTIVGRWELVTWAVETPY